MALEIPFTDPEAIAELERLLQPPEEEIIIGGKKMKLATAKRVGQVGGLKIFIYADEHPPPHFRVCYQGASANYRISNCERLTPGFGRHDRIVQEWHGPNKQKLITEWDNTRPTDCTVGRYREPEPPNKA